MCPSWNCTYQGEEDLNGHENHEEHRKIGFGDCDLEGNQTESSTQHYDDESHGKTNETSANEVGWSFSWSRRTIFLVKFLDLNGCFVLLVVGLWGDLRVPDKIHELGLDIFGPREQVVGICAKSASCDHFERLFPVSTIIPYDEQTILSDESRRMRLFRISEILHGRQNLHSQAISDRYVDGVRCPGKECLHNAAVDRHSAGKIERHASLGENGVNEVRWAREIL